MEKIRLERNKDHQKYFTSDGKVVPGASTVAKLGASAEGIIYWAWQLGIKGIDFRRARDSAADIGSIVHFMAECYLSGREWDLREYNDSEIAKAEVCYAKFLDFWNKENLAAISMETQLVSERGFGGTVDLVAKDENGKYVLVDYKSSKKIYPEMKRQVAAYRNLWNTNRPQMQISRSAIVRIGKEESGDVEMHWITDDKMDVYFETFLAQLALYQAIRKEK